MPKNNEHVIVSCPNHGTIAAPDAATARALAPSVRACVRDHGKVDHLRHHVGEGTDCWVCCSDSELPVR